MKEHIIIAVALAFLSGCRHVERNPAPSKVQDESQWLTSLNSSEEYKATLAWHRSPGPTVVRTSHCLHGKLGVVMRCEIDLTNMTVSTVREAHNWAHQNFKKRELTPTQLTEVKKVIAAPPASARPSEIGHIMIMSVERYGVRHLMSYDLTAIPPEISTLLKSVGAHVPTREEIGP